jgi:hypothetical protein
VSSKIKTHAITDHPYLSKQTYPNSLCNNARLHKHKFVTNPTCKVCQRLLEKTFPKDW